MERPSEDFTNASAPPTWPRITIVTPSFNQGQYIEQTICSVLDQEYPNLEYIVVDGGSTDNTVGIIKKYEKHLAWWVSEKDRGQAHAINKGFARATGEILNWLCSDDQCEPGGLKKVAEYFQCDEALDVVVGASRWMRDGRIMMMDVPNLKNIALMPWNNYVSQPSCFYRRRLLDRRPPLDDSLHYAMDLELWAYFNSRGAKWQCVTDVLSVYCWHGSNKTLTGGSRLLTELDLIQARYIHERIPLTKAIMALCIPLAQARARARTWQARKSLAAAIRLLLWVLGTRHGSDCVNAKFEQYCHFLVPEKN